MFRVLTTVAIGALLLAAEPLSAQPTPSWNRKTEGVSVLPAPAAGSFFDITFFASVDAADLDAPVDVSTEMVILINGTPVHTETHSLTANPSTAGDCAGLPCGTEPCICTPPPVVCECGPALITAATTTSMSPGDEIMVLLRPAPGAAPESDETDDLHLLPFPGDPIFWERVISSVEITPSPVESGSFDSFFDISVDICERARYSGDLNLESNLDLLVNGVPESEIPCALGVMTWQFCDPACSVPCVFDGGIQSGVCRVNAQDPSDCVCELAPVRFVFPAIPLEPDDIITVILRPVPGALPELPGFGDEDEQTRPVCPWDCGDGDFVVGVVDFLALLAQWGEVGALCDFDGGGVGVTDFLKMLGQWGPCFPQ